MKPQMYPIQKTDWLATVSKNKNGKPGIWYRHTKTEDEALAWARTKKGFAQLFKVSYEFRKAWPVGMKAKPVKKAKKK